MQVTHCSELNLTIEMITNELTDETAKNDVWQYLSSKPKIIVYFLFIIVVFMLCCVFVYWMNTNRRLNKNNKKKGNKSNQYFNPFDIIKMNDFRSKNVSQNNPNNNKNNNKNNTNNTNSCSFLLQPSTLDLNENDNELGIDPLPLLSEGDTRSEYSITDMERMNYVKQWIQNLS